VKTYFEGSINRLSKLILNYVSSNETFLEQSKKEKPEKVPFIIKSKYKIHTNEYQGHLFHTINEKSKNHKHIIYFHGGALCLNGGLPYWMMIDKWVKKTDAKLTYVLYPLIPKYTTSEIYDTSFEIYQMISSLYSDDELILLGDSAGGLVILSILQLINQMNAKKPKEIILLSPWIDYALKNPDIKVYEEHDKILSLARFEGFEVYDTIQKQKKIISPMEYTYDRKIYIYGGTGEMLYPDMLLFEEKNPKTDLKIFKDCPHVFMLFPMKQSDIVHRDIVSIIELL